MLKLNVGFTKKVGEANYGSRGAAVNLELELDSSLVGDAERLKERIRQLFGLAKTSVEEELAAAAGQPSGNGNGNGSAGMPSAGNGHAGKSNGRRRDGTRVATASQVRALNAIADRRKLNLNALLAERFQIDEPAGLTITEASNLIDELKGESAGNGQGGRR
ncbi:MAG: hypothetical protein JNL96_10320 [Planctomycetaceae bacterium]|nr:hypothetical protein [Planctomycetaceae bacterium]